MYKQLNTTRPGLIDRILIQAYTGTSSSLNTPGAWNQYLPRLMVEMGLWSRHGDTCTEGDTPDMVYQKMSNWKAQVSGGWMWLLDDMIKCGNFYQPKDYATAINTGLQP